MNLKYLMHFWIVSTVFAIFKYEQINFEQIIEIFKYERGKISRKNLESDLQENFIIEISEGYE